MTRPHYLADEVRARLARYEEMEAELLTLRASLSAAQSRVAALEAALRRMVHEAQCGFIHGLAKTTPDWSEAVDRYYDAARAALAPRSERREGEP